MAKLQELADLVGGEIVGDPELTVNRVAPIDQAGAGEITFIANPKYLAQLPGCCASAVIVAPGVESPGPALLRCANPYLAFAKVLEYLQAPPRPQTGIMAGALVADSAELAADVSVYPGAVIGERVRIGAGSVVYPGVVVYADAVIGQDCLLHAQAVVRESCQLGDRVILQPGAVIGSDGFGFAPDGAAYYKIPQLGIVVLEDDVEIGAGSCVDRAVMGETRIQRGTKLDNLVQVGHNVEIGADSILVSQVGIAGSTRIGSHCTFGGQVGIAGHLQIGDNVTIGGRGGATGNVDANQTLSGLPLMPHKEWLKATMTWPKLPAMRKEMQQLKKRLAQLEAMLEEE